MWGTVGLFVQNLSDFGLKPVDMAAMRLCIAGLALAAWLQIRSPGVLRLHSRKDLLLFVGTGSVSIALFNLFYFSSIGEIGMSLAVVLIYTGPGFVLILGRIWFGEPITPVKVASLLLMFIGVAFVSNIRLTGLADVSILGSLLGIAAAASFALYNLIGKYALSRYPSETVVVYTFLFSGFTLLPFSGLHHHASTLLQAEPFIWAAGLTIFPTLLAYLLYTNGLNRMEAGRASITGVSEILMAIILGILIFGESLSLYQSFGIIMVIGAMFLIRR